MDRSNQGSCMANLTCRSSSSPRGAVLAVAGWMIGAHQTPRNLSRCGTCWIAFPDQIQESKRAMVEQGEQGRMLAQPIHAARKRVVQLNE